jgi:hypothetical protein
MLRHHSHALDTTRVIVLTDPSQVDVVTARVTRAGGVAPRMIAWSGPTEVPAALEAGGVVLLTCRPDEARSAVHALIDVGARPIPTLGIDGDATAPRLSPSTRALLADPGLSDLEVPVPAVADDDTRRRLWDQLREIGAENRHHLVEVDGGPEGGWASLAAGAAGVLAGRRAAGDRRWRADLDG